MKTFTAKQKCAVLTTVLLLSLGVSRTLAFPVVLDQVPAYSWYHGCCPTAGGSVIGYWDLRGYDNFFDASGWNDVRLTANVQDQISSPEHNAKYDPTPDHPNLPDPPDTSIADFMHTSEEGRSFGGTSLFEIANPLAPTKGLPGYASFRGYDFTVEDYYGVITGYGRYPSAWDILTSEIDLGHPLVFGVDSDGDGYGDHCVPVIGYDLRGIDDWWYGLYTTWNEDENVLWARFQHPGVAKQKGESWGVDDAFLFYPTAPIPEPSTMLLLGSGLIGLWTFRKKFNN